MDAEVFRAVGLYDPAAPNAPDRLELLEFLAAGGVSVDRMREVYGTWGLPGLIESFIDDLGDPLPEVLTPQEVADRAGVPLSLVEKVRLAAGFAEVSSDVACLPESAVKDATAVALGFSVFGEARTLAFARVVGAAAVAVSEAALALLLDDLSVELAARPGGELAMLQARLTARRLRPAVPALFASFFQQRQPDTADRRRNQARRDSYPTDTHEMAVGFVDLVGSTAWAESVAHHEHREALAAFEAAAWTAAARHSTRMVKFIGDEAMFAAADPDAVCRVAIAVCRAAEQDEHLPPARAAVGFGTVVTRDGDYYGPIVNLVARATKAASPGAVVVTAAVADMLSPQQWTQTHIGSHELSGVHGSTQLFLISPAGTVP